MRAHRLLIAAALLTVVLVTSVLAALTVFAVGIGDAGLSRALQRQSAPRTVIDVRSDVTRENRGTVDTAVRAAARRAFDGLPVRVDASTRSGPYALPHALRPASAEDTEDPDLTLFVTLDRDRVEMRQGSWPGRARPGGRLPVALPETAAKRLGLSAGDSFRLTSRLSGPPPVRAEVTGVYRAKDRSDPYWRMDPLKGDGVRTLAFTTYGPLAVDDSAFTGEPAAGVPGLQPSEVNWQADADFTGMPASRIDALRDHVKRAVAAIGGSHEAPDATAGTELPELLGALDRSLLVTRSTLLIAALQLILLAILALLLVAQLLAAERATETGLLQARGGSRVRIAALSAAEAILLALPAAAAAPLLAVPVVRQLTTHGALARAGVDPLVQLPGSAWWVASGTALACAVTVVLPALRRPGEHGTPVTGVAPRRRTAMAMRGGADLALVGIAGVAYWQLERRAGDGTGVLTSGAGAGSGSGPGSGSASGPASSDGFATSLGIDPTLVAAPALALLAGTVLVLRLLPLVARLGERRATRGRGLAAALAGWHLSRRPLRGAGPALLLVLTVATGVFAVGQGASWDRSQGDQADFRTGADIAVEDSSAPPFGQGGIFDGVDGITEAAPVARSGFTVQGDSSAQVLATDTRAASHGLLRIRDDLLQGQSLPRLLGPLASGPTAGAAGAAHSSGVRLPRGTRQLHVTARLETLGDRRAAPTGDSLTLLIEDRFGVPYSFPLGDLPADGRPHRFTTQLGAAAGGTGGAPAGPLRVTRVTLSYTAPAHSEERRLTFSTLPSPDPDRQHWSSAVRADDPDNSLGSGQHSKPKVSVRGSGAPLTVRYATGSAPEPRPSLVEPVPVDIRLAAGPPQQPGAASSPLSAVATDAYLRASGARVGDQVKAQISGMDLTVHITGSVHALPGTSGSAEQYDAGALLFDLATLDRVLVDRNTDPLEPDGWWLATRPGATQRVAAELRAHPAVDTVLVRDELAAELRSDPLGAGPRTALTAIAVAAAVLAGTGFAVSSAGAVRERAGEFAVLRALGAPRRRLAQVLAAEQGLLVVLSLVVGLALGVLLTRLVVPLIVLTGEAALPVPELLVRLPLGPLTLLLTGILGAPLLVIAATALRRADPVAALSTERGD